MFSYFFIFVHVSYNFYKFKIENVARHILAPAAVACDIYFVRRSAHPRGAFFYLQESNFL